MCGADLRVAEYDTGRRGTSPHVRGRHSATITEMKRSGNIPACAGQTFQSFRPSLRSGEHPRMCGADILERHIRCPPCGTSPHVRGRPRLTQAHPCRPGNIPACAGQTPDARLFRDARAEHPRMCGADSPVWSCIIVVDGTSPHVRGRRPEERGRGGGERNIPACAGQTLICNFLILLSNSFFNAQYVVKSSDLAPR